MRLVAASAAGESSMTTDACGDTTHANTQRLVSAIEDTMQCAGLPIELIQELRDELSRRDRDEEALRSRERQFVTLAENAPDVVVRVDRNYRYLYVNPAMRIATGLAPECIVGKTARELGMPSDLCDLWEPKLDEVFAQRREISLEFQFPSPDGPRDY